MEDRLERSILVAANFLRLEIDDGRTPGGFERRHQVHPAGVPPFGVSRGDFNRVNGNDIGIEPPAGGLEEAGDFLAFRQPAPLGVSFNRGMNRAAQIGGAPNLALHVGHDPLGEVIERFTFVARQGECREDGLFLGPCNQSWFSDDTEHVGN